MKRLLTLSGRSTMRLPYRLLAFILGSTLLLTGCEEYLTDIELDPQAPLVTSFMIEPDSINITNVDAEVTTTVGVRGEVPVDSVRVTLEEQSAGLVSCLSTVPTEGDRENGSWACTIPFPTVAQAGRWHTASLEIFPEVGDRVLLIYDELEEAGYPHYLNVVKFGGLQIEAPTTTLRDIGEQVQLTAILRDDEGNIVPGIEPTWSSSAEEVATVDPEGLVEAVGEGTTTITARADGLEATLVVTVELGAGPQAPEIHAMVVRPDTVDLLDAGSVNYAVLAVFPATGSPALDTLSATLSGPNGQKLTCSDIQQIPVSELDPSIVENEFGVTLQEGAPDPWACSFDFEGGSQSDSLVGSWQVSEVVLGSSGELFVMSGGELADAGYDLTVEVIRSGSEVSFIFILPQEVTLTAEGDTAHLTATAYDQFENVVENVEFVWETSDESVALVDEAGVVTALGSGTATITASIGDLAGTATVTVEAAPAEYWAGWVQGGISTDRGPNIAISMDGVNWTVGERIFGITSSSVNGIATNGELWVITGNGTRLQTIATSVDAQNWTLRDSPLERGITAEWIDDRWYIGGRPGREGGSPLAVSDDGIEWTELPIPALTQVNTIAYNGTRWIVGGHGDGANVITSTDGVNWTELDIDITLANTAAWNGEIWVLVGQGEGATRDTDRILTSTDGIVWTRQESPVNEGIRDIAWNGANWVVAGRSNAGELPHIAISEDAINWTVAPSPFSSWAATSVVWNGKTWLMGGGFTTTVATSEDGLEWEGQVSPIDNSTNVLAWGGSRPINMAPSATITAPNFGAEYMAGDPIEFTATVEDAEDGTLPSSSIVWTSDLDGEIGTGTSLTTSSLSGGTHQVTLTATDSYGAVTRRVVEVEVIGRVGPGPVDRVIVQPQEVTLTAEGDTARLRATAIDQFENVVTKAEFAWDTSDESVALVDHEGLVTAMGPGTATITATTGGVSGTATLNVEIPVDYWPGWVAVGSTSASSPRLATSMDGEFWSPQEIPVTMIDVADVAANGERWMAVGGLFNETKLITSVDAVTWTAGQLPLDRGAAVIWADDKWVVSGRPLTTGGPNIAYSTDGETWSTVKVPNLTLVNNIAWNGELWIAVGSGGIATSPDLQSWTHRPADLTNGSAIGWNGEHWVVGGQGTGATGRLLSSTDGIDWTLHNALDAASYTDVVWNGATWIVTARPRIGDVPMMAYSGDSTNWIPIEDQAFSSLAYGIAWNGRHWVAVGGIGNNVARSFNGLDWDGPFFTGIGADANAIAWGGGEPVNQAPRVTVSAPGMVTEHIVGDDVEFSAIVEDAEDGTLPSSSIVWTSDLDGQIGTGASFSTSSLSGGVHKVTVTATDSYGAVTQRQIEVIMIEIVLDPELFGLATFPDTVNVRELGSAYNMGGAVVAVPAVGSAAVDSIVAKVKSPNSATFSCVEPTFIDGEEISPAEFEEILGVPKPEGIPNLAACIFDFGYNPDGPGGAPSPVEGTWRVSEIGLKRAGIWQILDETSLDALGYDLTFELIDEEPAIDWASVYPWRARIGADGDTVQLEATGGHFPNELPTPGVIFQWSSSDPSIATVDADGLVTAVGPGEVTIIAESGGVTAETNVQVIASGPPIAWDTVAAGFSHSCGLTNGTAYCWGKNEYGEVGNGGTETEVIPTRVAGGHTFSSIATGAYFTVGITPSGEAYAWGRNDNGQLGDGTTTDRLVPVPVSGQNAFSMVSAAANHVVALTTAGEIYTWGNNDRGQLGNDGMPRDNLVPVRVGGSPILGETFTSVSAGNFFTVALRSDSIAVTWGMNNSGQLGHGNMTTSNPTPTMVMRQDGTGFHRFTTLFATSTDVVALDADGQAWGWGRGFAGSHGNGQNAYSAWPVKALGGHTFVWIGGGGNYRFAIDTNGQTWGWGEGTQGRLGLGDDVSHWEPVLVTHGFVKYAVGDSHTIALDASGMAYSWGNNLYDVLGIASYDSAFEPVPVLGPLD